MADNKILIQGQWVKLLDNGDGTFSFATESAEGIDQSVYASAALAASGVVKASTGKLFSFLGYNDNAAAQYIQIFNSAAVPADTAVPIITLYVAAKSNFTIDLGFHGLAFATGISWSNSSTIATKTIGAADCWLVASYK